MVDFITPRYIEVLHICIMSANNKPKVLIVDDEIAIQETLSLIVERLGVIPSRAGDGLEALEMIQKQQFDMVITDLKMPHMNGMEFLKRAKEIDEGVPIVVITAFGSIQIAVEALKNGALNFLTKPFKAREVEQVLQKGLHLRESVLETKEIIPYLNTILQFEIPSSTRFVRGIISAIAEQSQRVGFRKEDVAIRTCLSEALTNAIKHGNNLDENKKVRVEAFINHNYIKIKVEDEGEGFDTTTLIDPTEDSNLSRSDKRGLFLIKCLMDDVSFNDKGTSVTFVKYKKG